jgi:hypothetical protein
MLVETEGVEVCTLERGNFEATKSGEQAETNNMEREIRVIFLELNMDNNLRHCSYVALLAGARKVAPAGTYDEKGYVSQGGWKNNLWNGLPKDALDGIEHDFRQGAGHELDEKMGAAHSSAALAVNTFGLWRTAPAALTFARIAGFSRVRFEATCVIWEGRTPPHLDLLADGDLPVAVESKCTEWMHGKSAEFSPSYDELQPSTGNSPWFPWFEQMLQLRKTPNRYEFLDAAQIVKHAFGLLSVYNTREVRLIYLYWEPRNAEDWPACGQHRGESHDLASKVEQSTVRLIPLSYQELWSEWQQQGSGHHLQYLRDRYDLEL